MLANKNILVMGLRNKWSIAWGIVEAAHKEGANIIITYQGDREKSNAEDMANLLGGATTYQCDILSDQDIEILFSSIKEKFGVLHGIVHSIAHAKTEDLQNDFIYTSRDGFLHAMNVSAYSLVAVCQKAKDLMTEGGSVITLTYMGSEKVCPGYNVMGVAKAALEASVRYLAYDMGAMGVCVNAISAGPIKTLSSKGVKSLGTMLSTVEGKSPLKRGITQQDVGNTAIFLLSNLASAITGEIIHVDCGYNIVAG